MSSALHLSLYFPILKACWTPFSSSLITSIKLLLKRIDNRDVKGSIFANGPEGEQDISRAVIAAREKPRGLFPRTQGFLRCSCKENEMVDKK